VKLCVDCRHVREATLESSYHETCAAPGVPRDPVDGAREWCFSARGITGACGAEAKFFEARDVKEKSSQTKSFWQKFFGEWS
jgi:hypothetical protein